MRSDLVCVQAFRTRMYAEWARERLAVAGIPALVLVDDEGGAGAEPTQVTGGPARLVVHRRRAAAARRCLADWTAPA